MRKILFIIQKEFLQIFRNRAMLPIIFMVPIIQLVILVHAATFEIKNIDMMIVDKDFSPLSKKLAEKFKGSDFFRVRDYSVSIREAKLALEEGKVEAILHFKAGFERNLVKEHKADLGIIVDAVNSRAAGLINGYIMEIVANYNREIMGEIIPQNKLQTKNRLIQIQESYWYNPELNYKNYMVPGILVILVTIIGTFLSSMNIVREKEIGTIEQLNVTPVGKFQFIIGKLIPFMIIGLFEFAFGLTIGIFIFHIPVAGSIPLLFAVATVFLFTVLGVGLLISTMNDTQQQALLVSYFFMMLFLLMSGLFTPLESMPGWALWINKVNPVTYFLKINRMIILKGSGITDIFEEAFSLLVLGIVIFNLAVMKYKKIQ
ncbi:MAG: ABC transporter permease [Fidelibacterota bacterium]